MKLKHKLDGSYVFDIGSYSISTKLNTGSSVFSFGFDAHRMIKPFCIEFHLGYNSLNIELRKISAP